jgi:GTPase involved in cell partitioning and DNA repair
VAEAASLIAAGDDAIAATLLDAITSTAAAAHYPFCTIVPNRGRIGMPDPRLEVGF